MSLNKDAGAASSTVRLALAAVGDETGIMAAVELGNQARATLGHMPHAGYREAAASHTLLLAYAAKEAPALLSGFGFAPEKIPAVVEAIRTHLPSASPTSREGVLLRDADILEQLGAIGILRTVSKVGRDSRFGRFSDALRVLRQNLERLPAQLQIPAARRLAEPRVKLLKAFLDAAETEAGGVEW